MSGGRYQAYPEYKDSNTDWLGEIPSEWNAIPVGRLFRRLKRMGHVEKELLSVYRDYGVIPKSSRDDNNNKPSEDLTPYQLVERNDLVLNKMKAWQGSIAVSEYEGIVSPAYFVYQPRENFFEIALPRYVHFLLRNPAYISQYLRRSKGIRVSQWDLDPEEFQRIELVLPTIPEQTQIAAFLDHETAKIDRLIEQQQELIRLLKEKRQAVISHAVTKGLNPQAPLKDSGIPWLGQVPAHWKEYPLKTLCRIKHGYAFDSDLFSDIGEFTLLTPGNFVQRGGFRHMNPPKYYIGKNYPAEFVLKPRQLLVAMTEQGPGLLGCALFVPEEGTYLHNQRLGLVKDIHSEKLSHRYLFHLFNSPRYRAEVSISATGTKVQHTSPEKLLSIRVWIPEVPEQNAIADFIEAALVKFDASEAKADHTITLLQERRTALISAAVTGKIDVRHWQPVGVSKMETTTVAAIA